jgi:tight adherence protein C
MIILMLIIATVLLVTWILLLTMVTREEWIIAAYNKVLDNLNNIEKLKKKDSVKLAKLNQYDGISYSIMKIFLGGDSSKEIRKLEQSNARLQKGNLSGVNIFILPGYVLLRKYKNIGESTIYTAVMTKCIELYGRKHAAKKAAQLIAGVMSYPTIGIAVSLGLGALLLAVGYDTFAFTILIIGTLLILVLVYAMYDEVNDRLNKRRDAIQRQFPNVVSKLALLVTSGMIMDKAWKETAASQDLELYREMQKTSEELDNLVSPEAAYGGFLDRCNTKETAKLASSIMQNLSKGNAEIGILLKDMAKEAWQERRHTAKRDAEKANSKLMIPTMLLLLAILVMIMVPVAMNFTAL